MAKSCVNCGHQLHEKAQVCPNCGQCQPLEPLIERVKRVFADPPYGYSGYSGLSGVTSPFGSFSDDPRVQDLKKQILDLQAEVSRQAHQLQTEKADKAQKEAQSKEFEKTLLALTRKKDVDFLLNRVTAKAEDAVLATDLCEGFFTANEQSAFVVSIDIRRSTELMLKAHKSSDFATFMTELCFDLETAIKDEFGVFDKFTGDGVLAFFPEFFSGPDAGYHALAAAQKALAIFADSYRRNRPLFATVLRDANLAVGIDFGGVHFVRVAGDLTAVGGAVVYACRLSDVGPPGTVLLNQPAYEKISDAYGDVCLMSETSIDIKHEGEYCVTSSNRVTNYSSPHRRLGWKNRIHNSKKLMATFGLKKRVRNHPRLDLSGRRDRI
jgi:class 3 adenylate cyclase